MPDATIAVSKSLQSFYAAQYRRSVDCIPNGVDAVEPIPPCEIPARFGLRGRDYVLFVGRLVPEKAPDLLIRAFRHVEGPTRLVIAGGSSHTNDYVRALEKLAARDERVILAGYVYGTLLAELYSNAAAFVLPSELEGLPLTLLEAAAYGVPVIASDIDPHVEMLIDDGPGHRFFRRSDESHLARVLRAVLESPDAERRGSSVLRDRITSDYQWEQVVTTTERVYRRVVGRGRDRPDVATGPIRMSRYVERPNTHIERCKR